MQQEQLTPRVYGFPQGVNEPFWLFDNDAALKAHLRYKEAKAGGVEAAVELVSDVALEFLVSIKDKLPCDAIYLRRSDGAHVSSSRV